MPKGPRGEKRPADVIGAGRGRVSGSVVSVLISAI